MKLLLTSTLCLLLGGCTGIAPAIRALSKDQALTTIEVKTLYGSGRIIRDGRPQNGTTISEGGAITSTQPTNQPVAQPAFNGLNITPN